MILTNFSFLSCYSNYFWGTWGLKNSEKLNLLFAMEMADEISLQTSKCRKMEGLGSEGNLLLYYGR